MKGGAVLRGRFSGISLGAAGTGGRHHSTVGLDLQPVPQAVLTLCGADPPTLPEAELVQRAGVSDSNPEADF